MQKQTGQDLEQLAAEVEDETKALARRITKRITEGPEAEDKFREGCVVKTMRTGTRYRIENVHMTPWGKQATIRREVPKIKGKAARKAARAARRAGTFR